MIVQVITALKSSIYEIGFLTVTGCSSVWLDSNENWTCGRFKLCLAIKLDPTVCFSAPVVIRVNASHFSCQYAIDYGYLYHSIIKHNPWRMTVNADEDDYRTGCRNVSHCQQQQSYSGLCSPGTIKLDLLLKSLFINRNLLWYINFIVFFLTSCSLTLENTLYAIKHWFEVKHRLFVLDIIFYTLCWNWKEWGAKITGLPWGRKQSWQTKATVVVFLIIKVLWISGKYM